jgi:hypothetical protein
MFCKHELLSILILNMRVCLRRALRGSSYHKKIYIMMKQILITIFLLISIVGNATTYYLSPSGNDINGTGSIGSPWFTLNKAWTVISAGDTIYMHGGTYSYNTTMTVLADKSGASDNLIKIWAYPDEYPVIDYTGVVFTSGKIGIRLHNCNYIHLKGLRITNIAQPANGNANYGIILYDEVSNCIFERMETDHIGGWGVVLADDCNNNLFLNCDSHHNQDPLSTDPYGGADGFETGSHTPDHTSTNNVFRGCRAWSNSDDGWDLRQADGIYTLENCWSFWNGFIPGTFDTGGNGDGYKLGGKTAPGTDDILRTIRNSVAYRNRGTGITPEPDGSDLVVGLEISSCIAYKNGSGWGEGINSGGYNNYARVRNCIAYDNFGSEYWMQGGAVNDHNDWNLSVTVSDADFVSVTPTSIDGARQADGSLPDLDFLHLALGSYLIDAGIDVGLSYNGSAPDLGAFEFTGINNHSSSIMNQSFQVDENSINGTVVGTVVASDPDAGQTLEYSIVSGNTDGAFAINASTGELTVANSAAVIADFALVVQVQDNGTDNLSNQATITINVIPTGIESTGNNSTIKVYPNPVSDELIIVVEGNKGRQGFEILNSISHIVYKGYLRERTVVSTTDFSPGVYFIKSQNGNKFEFKKIIKL